MTQAGKYSIITAQHRRGSASDNIKAKLPLCGGGLLSTTVTGFGVSQTSSSFEAAARRSGRASADGGAADRMSVACLNWRCCLLCDVIKAASREELSPLTS